MAGRVRRYAAFAYGLVAALTGLATIAYLVGFVANAVVPKSIDAGATHELGHPLVVNLALVGLFGLQHSLMARPRFKAAWTRIAPDPIGRSTYVLFSSAALALLLWGWRPLPDVVWAVDGPAEPLLWAVHLGGWLVMFAGVFSIDATDLLGVRQVAAALRGRRAAPLEFQTPALYRFVRHPIMTGFLVAFWVTPVMTVGHLVFAAGMTGYVLIGVALEERDLVAAFGDRYRQYSTSVPRFVPRPGRTAPSSPEETD